MKMNPLVHFFLLSAACFMMSNTVPVLQQTVPPEGAGVCPLNSVKFTCVTQNELTWRDLNTLTAQPAYYGPNQTLMTGVFRTVLTDIIGNTLTSTATIDSVILSNNGIMISCRDGSGATNQQVSTILIASIPQPPNNFSVVEVNVTSDTESSVNLTWSLDNQCVVVYHVEVTNTNTSNITNMNTTSQYIVLTLQTSIVYSFRVRGADSAGRGQWSEVIVYYNCPVHNVSASKVYIVMTATVKTPQGTVEVDLFQPWTIALFATGGVLVLLLMTALIAVPTTIIVCKKLRARSVEASNEKASVSSKLEQSASHVQKESAHVYDSAYKYVNAGSDLAYCDDTTYEPLKDGDIYSEYV